MSTFLLAGKQFSLDSRMDLVVHGIEGTSTNDHDDIDEDRHANDIAEDPTNNREGMKGRYCSGTCKTPFDVVFLEKKI